MSDNKYSMPELNAIMADFTVFDKKAQAFIKRQKAFEKQRKAL